MLLDTTILVLRETLEASVLLAVLLSIAANARLGGSWLYAGAVGGTILSIVYSNHFGLVSGWFDYAGQEVMNAAMQLAISVGLLVLVFWRLYCVASKFRTMIMIVMLLVVVFALARELTELVVFYSGLLQSQASLTNAMTGGFAGLTIGVSIGVLVFATIDSLSKPVQVGVQLILLAFVAAGSVVQAIQLLMQVDWLNATAPVWDTNYLLAEPSIAGQMLYAVFGYEATPSMLEVVSYFSILSIVLGAMLIKLRWHRSAKVKHHYV